MVSQIIGYATLVLAASAVALGSVLLVCFHRRYQSVLKLFSETKKEIADHHEKQNAALAMEHRCNEESFRQISESFARAADARTKSAETICALLRQFNAEETENRQKTAEKITAAIASLEQKVGESREKMELFISAQFEQSKEALAAVNSNLLKQSEENGRRFQTVDDAISRNFAALSEYANQTDRISDQCTLLSEMLSALKKETEKKIAQLSADTLAAHQGCMEKFTDWEENLRTLKTEIASLQKGFSAALQACTRQNGETLNLLELRLAGINASLQLLESHILKQAGQQKTEESGEQNLLQDTGLGPTGSDPNGDQVKFETLADGKTISRTYRKGKLIFEILHSSWGTPENGKMYAENGEIIKQFEYDSNGQVK